MKGWLDVVITSVAATGYLRSEVQVKEPDRRASDNFE